MSFSTQEAVPWILSMVLVGVLTTVLGRRRRELRGVEAENQQLSQELRKREDEHAGLAGTLHEREAVHARALAAFDRDRSILEQEFTHLVERQLPDVQRGLWQGQGSEAPASLFPELDESWFGSLRDAVLDRFRDVTVQAAERAEDSSRAAVAAMARSMQMLTQDTTRAIDDMLNRHHEPAVLADLTRIDHANSQLVRRLQGTLVLTGSWPGRKRDAAPLLDAVRGGVSKIRDYQRVEITGSPAYAVVDRAVEPVTLAVAELLDNAARHSTPRSSVRVGFLVGHKGVTVTIDDSGTGLKPEEREAAPEKLSGTQPVLLTQMGSRPEFGFPVVGALAGRYGFRVSVDEESIYGGVRAAVFLPTSMLTQPKEQSAVPAGPPVGIPLHSGAPMTSVPGEAGPRNPALPRASVEGLPQRRRQQTPDEPALPHTVEPPTGSGPRLGAFVRGRRAAQKDHQREDERNSN